MSNTVCIYIDGNLDSFAAAWALWKVEPNARFFSDITCVLPEDIQGRDVYVMGTGVPLAGILAMAPFTQSLTVFAFEDSVQREYQRLTAPVASNVQIVLEVSCSLCKLAWGYFHGSATPPLVLHYLEDRALWRFQYPDSRAVYAALLSYPQDLETWDDILTRKQNEQLIVEGNVVLRRITRDIEYIIRQQRRRIDIGGYNVPLVNVNPHLAVDTGLLIAKGEPFAACYWDTPTGRQYELISSNGGIDVGEFVQIYGGHGHSREATFKVERNHPLATA